MHKAYSMALVIGLLCLLGVPALGAPILVYNTGLGAASPGDLDSNWTVQGGPAYEVMGSASAQFPFNGYWLASDTVSQWIAPQTYYYGGATDAGGVNYVFRTTFSLSGLIPGTAQIQGQWLADNQGVEVYLNDQALGFTTVLNGFKTWSVFTIPAGSPFSTGMNTLDFVVYNSSQTGGNPVGLRVEFTSATADLVPEPGTFALLGIGLVGVGIFYRRRKRS